MSLTPFGILFLALTLVVAMRARAWMLPWLAFSACLHGPAVAVIGGRLGITPWLVASFAVFIDLLRRVARDRRIELGTDRFTRRVFAGWTAFAAIGVLSAFTLPFLFEGLPTYNSERVYSIWAGTEPLRWRTVNAAQAINLAIAWMLLLYALQVAHEPGLLRRLVLALAAGGVLSVMFSLLQRFVMPEGGAVPAWIASSLNPSYHQTIGHTLGGVARMNWPFSEPSYASAWFGSIFAAGLAVFSFTRHRWQGLALAAIALAGVLNSLGGSGLLVVAVSCSVAWVLAACRLARLPPAQRQTAARPWIAATLGGVVLAIAAANVHRIEGFERLTVQNFYQWIVLPRLVDHQVPGPSRHRSNLEALNVVGKTRGLGVGLGSNRASSYALNLASNVGLVPALLFFVLVIAQARAAWRARVGRETHVFLVAGLAGMAVAVLAAIPDLLWPAWWIWIIATFAAMASSRGLDVDHR